MHMAAPLPKYSAKRRIRAISCYPVWTAAANPYDRGISAFGSWENTAMRAELACLKEFENDLRDILIHFLESCSYE